MRTSTIVVFAGFVSFASLQERSFAQDAPYIEVIRAWYYATDHEGKCEFTANLKSCENKQACGPFKVLQDKPCADPAGGTPKLAHAIYWCKWLAGVRPVKLVASAKEGEDLNLSCAHQIPVPDHASTIHITKAIYGYGENANNWADIVDWTGDFCDGRVSCDFAPHNGIKGDPAGGSVKSAKIQYQCVPNGWRGTPALADREVTIGEWHQNPNAPEPVGHISCE